MYDVIVSGAGPAGSTIARRCANQGYKVLLLEQFEFPRQKLCGGGLTPFVYRHLDLDVSHLILNKSQKLRFTYKNKQGDLYSMKSLWIDMVDRAKFDEFLCREAVISGVEFKDNEKTLDFIQNKDSIEVFTDKAKYKSRFLIGADGVYSRIAQKMGFKVNKDFFMLQVELAFKQDLKEEDKNIVIFDVGSVKKGCAWLFPKGEFASLGVCTSKAKMPCLRNELDKFIQIYKHLFVLDNIKYKGIIVPYYRPTKKKLADLRVMLVGDAARLMNPMTGEGISTAVWSANIASEFVLGALEENKPVDYNKYTDTINKQIGKNLKISYFASELIETFPKLAFNLFLKKGPKMLNMFLDPLR